MRSSSLRRGAALRPLLAALAAALLVVVLVEVGFRAAGIGAPPAGAESTLRYQHVWPPLVVPGSRPDGTAARVTNDPRTPWQAALDQRPEDDLRIVVVGGSAVAGLGYGPNVSFPRHLERLLSLAYPGRHVEVLNLGIVALSSREVRAITEDVLPRLAPDALIVYSGNNEFLELHAEEFSAADRSALDSLTTALVRTNTLRALRSALGRAPRRRPLSNNQMAGADARVTEAELLEKAHVTEEQKAAVVDTYEENLEAITMAARDAHVPVLLCTVATNWEWRGREDLAQDWFASIEGQRQVGRHLEPEDWRDLLERFEEHGGPGQPEPGTQEWFFRRGFLAEQALEWELARDSYRASMNADPNLRRASDELADRVRAVAQRTDAHLFDAIEGLAARSPHGIVGFQHFYDYVHFTPAGCTELAALLHDALAELDLVQGSPAVSPAAYVEREAVALANLESDPLDVDRWLGTGFDLARIGDRDLWKHAKAMAEVDAVIDDSSETPERRATALAWRGNLGFFLVDGADNARADYEASLALREDATVRENLRRLTTTRRP